MLLPVHGRFADWTFRRRTCLLVGFKGFKAPVAQMFACWLQGIQRAFLYAAVACLVKGQGSGRFGPKGNNRKKDVKEETNHLDALTRCTLFVVVRQMQRLNALAKALGSWLACAV
ncbi:hypothetical protein C0Q70_08348 [Pomacea canaliculata]|uniref:Uncharacterized protein n=1 Tax=Pomacea canaliculata TaxID=400727 RepID=A0A2T7PHK1_POMCA|nr:hypothetical protein C0Q70_08348 [Pomacea canaliculata]